MLSVVIWAAEARALATLVRNCVPLTSAVIQAEQDRWLVELGADDYVFLTREDSIWTELEEEDYERIVKEMPVPILFRVPRSCYRPCRVDRRPAGR